MLTGKHQHQTKAFPGVIKKNSVKFPGILVLALKTKLLKGEHNFVEFVGVKLCLVWSFKG